LAGHGPPYSYGMSLGKDRRGFEVERSKIIFDDFFRVKEVWFRRRDERGVLSAPQRNLSLERGDSVAVLMHNTDTGRLILVEQFRYPAHADGGWLIETVAGMIDKGESPEEAVRREAFEETGYQVGDLRHLATFYTSPGGSSERIYLYFGEVTDSARTGAGGGLAEEGEAISLREYTPRALADAMAGGEFKDVKTLLAVQWFLGRQGTRDV
jgi:nudix-type nucleoside diphosphatase (YffH/AdpP family)